MRVRGFVIGAFSFNVCFARNAMETFDLTPFDWSKTAHVLVVIIWVVPDGTRGFFGSIDKELMVQFVVVLADPAIWESSSFIFHGTATLRWNAISGSMSGVVGDGTLGIWWRRL
jgi:hypothetical protein